MERSASSNQERRTKHQERFLRSKIHVNKAMFDIEHGFFCVYRVTMATMVRHLFMYHGIKGANMASRGHVSQ